MYSSKISGSQPDTNLNNRKVWEIRAWKAIFHFDSKIVTNKLKDF